MSAEAGDKPAASTAGPYEGVGNSLKIVRERQGLSLVDVAARTRIRRQHLDAIEGGRFTELPGPIYITGFLRTYAETLGLDPEQVVQNFQSESDIARQRKELVFPMPRPEQRTPRLLLVLLALIVAIGAYAVWYRYQETFRSGAELVKAVPGRLADLVPPPTPIMAAPRPAPTPAAPAAAATASAPVPAPAPTPSASPATAVTAPVMATAPVPPAPVPATPTPAASPVSAASPAVTPAPPPTPAPAPAPAPVVAAAPAVPVPVPVPTSATAAVSTPPATSTARFGGDPGRVVIKADAQSWVQVRGPNNEPLFTRLMAAGESYAVPGREGLTLATGNAGGILLTLDGKALPRLGDTGEVKRGVTLDAEGLKTALKVE